MDLNAAPSFGTAELFIGDDDALSLVASVASGGPARTTHTSTAGKAPIKERKRKRSESKSGVAVAPKAKRDVPKLKPDLFEAEKPAGSRNPRTVQLRFQEEFNNLLWVGPPTIRLAPASVYTGPGVDSIDVPLCPGTLPFHPNPPCQLALKCRIIHGIKKYDDETTKVLESIVRLQVIETVSLRNIKALLDPPPPRPPPSGAIL